MTDTASLHAAFGPDLRRALLLGTSRVEWTPPGVLVSGARDGDRWPHAAAAILGAAAAYGSVAPPSFQPAEDPLLDGLDPSTLVPGDLRSAMVRLCSAEVEAQLRSACEVPIAHALDRAGIAVHPFDLDRLAGLIRARSNAHPIELRLLGDDRQADAIEEADDVDSLLALPRAALRDHLERGLAEDAAAARVTARGLFEGAPAATRELVIETLRGYVEAGDEPWLRSCLDDRSSKVRAAAGRLLEQIPGTPEAEGRVARALEAVEVKRTGRMARLAGKSAVRLKLNLERAKNSDVADVQALRRFEGIGLGDLCEGLELERDAVFAGAKADGPLQTALLAAAIHDGDRDAIDAASKALPDASRQHLMQADWGSVDGYRAAVGTFRRDDWAGLTAVPYALETVSRAFPRGFDARAALDLLSSPGMKVLAKQARDADAEPAHLASGICSLVALTRSEAPDALTEFLAPLPLAATAAARSLLPILERLDQLVRAEQA